MRFIEVRSARAKFPQILGQMREWLDRNDRPLVRFEIEAGNRGMIIIKVQFEAEDLGRTVPAVVPRLLQRRSEVLPGARSDHAQPGANLSRSTVNNVSPRAITRRGDRKERRVGRVSIGCLRPAILLIARSVRKLTIVNKVPSRVTPLSREGSRANLAGPAALRQI
jgi:hypothetical protein